MRLGQQALTVLGIVAAALAAVSCSGSTEPCHDALKLRITGSDGARPAEFVAAVTLGEAATQVVE